jgi:hypothetical protein
MCPAIECRNCDFKAKTAHEPANEDEMRDLFYAFSAHDLDNVNAALRAISGKGKGKGAHTVELIYHEKTPAKGFEDAEVVG